ncbi:MAG: hypothetical protein [Podoviridae sp. ctg2L5]|nr:MAG: hypothetical protein [Podoviridae sp. ctg2L5]
MTDNKLATRGGVGLSLNDNLAQMYKDSAKMGSENLSQELPLLKIHSTGRSTANELANGKEPNDGYFFYKPTREQFKEVTVHILTISRGFRAEGLEGKQDVFHQVLSGVIVDNGEMKPFMMYFTGIKLSNLWAFGKEASAYTKAKPVPIPMFALTVKLTTSKEKHSYGTSWVVQFEIIKDKKGVPEVITDEGTFVFLKDSIETVEETISSLISARTGEEEEVNLVERVGTAQTAKETQEAVGADTGKDEEKDIDGEDIPF